MQLPVQCLHYKQAFLPLSCPTAVHALSPWPQRPLKTALQVLLIQSLDQYSCQPVDTLTLLIEITIGRLQLSLHLSAACHNVIKISRALSLPWSVTGAEALATTQPPETTDSCGTDWGWEALPRGWEKSSSLLKLCSLPLPKEVNGRAGAARRRCKVRLRLEAATA